MGNVSKKMSSGQTVSSNRIRVNRMQSLPLILQGCDQGCGHAGRSDLRGLGSPAPQPLIGLIYSSCALFVCHFPLFL